MQCTRNFICKNALNIDWISSCSYILPIFFVCNNVKYTKNNSIQYYRNIFVSLQIWFVLVAAMTFTTTACFVLNMYDDFRVDRESIPALPNNATYNLFYSNLKRKTLLVKAAPMESLIVEGTCNALLLLDLLIRFAISHQKKSFVLNIQNIIEVIVGMFCFLVINIDRNPQIVVENLNLDTLIVIIGGFYSLRVLKLLRLAESTAEMKILKLCFQRSWKILGFLVMVFTIFSTIFGCGMFWAEFNNAETFPKIGISIWWAIVTITTVGYGDHYPKSTFGYIICSVTALIGLCLIAMPIATLSSNFSNFYYCYFFRMKYLNAKKTMKRKQINKQRIDYTVVPFLFLIMVCKTKHLELLYKTCTYIDTT